MFRLTLPQRSSDVNWGNPAPIAYGTPLSGAQLNARASIPGTFVYSPAINTVLNAGSNALSVVFTPNDAVNYRSATNSVSLTVSPASLTVTPLPQAKTYGQTVGFGSGGTGFASTGLKLGEIVGTVTLTVGGDGGAATAPAGTYAIVPSAATGGTFDPDNYDILYETATLTVNELPVVLTGTRGYDGTLTAAWSILTVSNAVGSDIVNLASGFCDLAGSNVGANVITDAGTLALGGASYTNYTLAGVTGAVVVTNPLNPFSIIISSVHFDGTNFALCWHSVPGAVYTVLTNINVSQPRDTWDPAADPITATSAITCCTISDGNGGTTNLFFLIKQQ